MHVLAPSRWSSGCGRKSWGEGQSHPDAVRGSGWAGEVLCFNGTTLICVLICNKMFIWLMLTMVFLFMAQNGNAAASLNVAEQYVSAFSKLAKESNTILLPSNTGDISSMVTQVLTRASLTASASAVVSHHIDGCCLVFPLLLRPWPSTARWRSRAQSEPRRRRRGRSCRANRLSSRGIQMNSK